MNKPSVPRKAINFTKAIIKHTINGLSNPPESVQKERLDKCFKCMFRQGLNCEHEQCGCVLAIKVQWASERCPIGEWDEYIESS